jgi:hypothetical protein
MTVEPELQRNVQGTGWDRRGFSGKFGSVTNHDVVTIFVFLGLGEFLPDVEPLTVVAVNLLASDFDIEFLDHDMTDVSDPGLSTGASKSWEFDLEISLVNEITISGNGGGNLTTKVDRSTESLLDRFEGKIGMTAIHRLKNDYTPPFGVF